MPYEKNTPPNNVSTKPNIGPSAQAESFLVILPRARTILLWLFGEKYHETINVPVRAKNLPEANDEMALRTAEERSTAESLFPESLFYLRINGFNEPKGRRARASDEKMGGTGLEPVTPTV